MLHLRRSGIGTEVTFANRVATALLIDQLQRVTQALLMRTFLVAGHSPLPEHELRPGLSMHW